MTLMPIVQTWWTGLIELPNNPLLHTFHFGDRRWLWLLLLIPVLWWKRSRPGRTAAVRYSSLDLLKEATKHTRSRRGIWPRIFRALALALIVIALAEPRLEKDTRDQKTEGIDIMLVLDESRSMDSKDFDFGGKMISRTEALQKVIADFIKDRPRDRIGVIGFAERPFLVSPLTLDHSWMMEALAEVKTSLGTAIGSAVEASVDLLRKSDSPNKIAIVVTDGLNTSGVDPLQSARTAQRFGIRLYTIGVVSYADMQVGGVDKLMLSQMSTLSGGQFFQAANGTSLRSIYAQIDQLERREFKQAKLHAYRELFAPFAMVALGALLAELLMTQGRRVRIP